jgi:RHS repeat-associated protein
MSGRKYNTTGTEFGQNGMREDVELNGEGNSYDFGARIYDPRLGKWLSTDPLEAKYAGLSPFNYVANSPVQYKDDDGRDIIAVNNNSKSLIKAALNEAFGKNNGFDFDEAGKLFVKTDVYSSLDPKQKILYELFVKDLVNNPFIKVKVYNTKTARDPAGAEVPLDGGTKDSKLEFSWTMFGLGNGPADKMFGVGKLYVGTMGGYQKSTFSSGISYVDEKEAFWHGVGHQLTNWKYKLTFEAAEDEGDIRKAATETVGIQNLYREIVNAKSKVTGEEQHIYEKGTNEIEKHKNSGTDNSILNQKPSGNPNQKGDGGSNDPGANNGRGDA